MLSLGAVAALLGPRTFMRLEALDGRGEFQLPALVDRTSAATTTESIPRRPRRALRLLVMKELRLQTPAFVVAIVFVAVKITLPFAGIAPDVTASLSTATTLLHRTLIAILVGALASAEERSYGTLEWQLLQPMAALYQWFVKVATAMTVAVVLGIVLPWAVEIAIPAFEDGGLTLYRLGVPSVLSYSLRWAVGLTSNLSIVVLLLSCALYVSSVSSGGLRAVLMTLPVVTVAASVSGAIISTAGRTIERGLDLGWRYDAIAMQRLTTWTPGDYLLSYRLNTWLRWGVLVGFVLLLLMLAMRNHRAVEHGSVQVQRQAGWLVAYVVIGAAALGAIPNLVFWMLATR
jgi:hypothetical protein